MLLSHYNRCKNKNRYQKLIVPMRNNHHCKIGKCEIFYPIQSSCMMTSRRYSEILWTTKHKIHFLVYNYYNNNSTIYFTEKNLILHAQKYARV